MIVQGKPVARRGRKARDLRLEAAQLPVREQTSPHGGEGYQMKANLARFMWVIALLSAMALTTGAGIRWGFASLSFLQ